MEVFCLHNCKKKYKQAFEHALKAIKCGNMKNLEASIINMKANSGSYPTTERCLDVVQFDTVYSKRAGKICYMFMTLLSHAVIQKKKEIVKYLIQQKASVLIQNGEAGSPLTQALVYTLHNDSPDVFDEEITEDLIRGVPGENFDQDVVYEYAYGESSGWQCTPIELAIQNQKFDIAKQLVISGANPQRFIVRGSQLIFEEFLQFGTNKFLFWLLHEHYNDPEEASQFIEHLLEKKEYIFNEVATEELFKLRAGRHHAHAVLTCGHRELTRKFIERYPVDDDGEKMLTVRDPSGRTALQIAAAHGDLESVKILLGM